VGARAARWWAGVAMAAVALGGCGPGPQEVAGRRQALGATSAELAQELDTLEDRLLTSQARVRLWQDLGERHRTVTAVACQNVEGHVQAMARHLEKQESKARRARRRPPSPALSQAPPEQEPVLLNN
jgi:hypothetical protein